MFVGTFEHQLDDKGRVVLPAKFRDRLAAGGYVTQGAGRSLAVWTPDEFETEAREMRAREKRGELDRMRVLAVSANTADIKPDTQGRIAIPANLRSYAGLTGAITFIGAIDHILVWDTDAWRAHNDRASESLASS